MYTGGESGGEKVREVNSEEGGGLGFVSLNRSPLSQSPGEVTRAGPLIGYRLADKHAFPLANWCGVFHVDSSLQNQMSDSAALAGCLYLANYCSRAFCCLPASPWERSHGLSVRSGFPQRHGVIDKHMD